MINRIDSIKLKVKRIESLLDEIKNELETLTKEENIQHKKQRQAEETLPAGEELRSEYNRLYQEFVASNSKAIEEFIKGKSKAYLKTFCSANNLPVDTTKVSKDRIVDIVMQWLAQRKAITQKTK